MLHIPKDQSVKALEESLKGQIDLCAHSAEYCLCMDEDLTACSKVRIPSNLHSFLKHTASFKMSKKNYKYNDN